MWRFLAKFAIILSYHFSDRQSLADLNMSPEVRDFDSNGEEIRSKGCHLMPTLDEPVFGVVYPSDRSSDAASPKLLICGS